MAKQERKKVTKMRERFFRFILASYFLSQLFFVFQPVAVFTASLRSRSALWRHLQEKSSYLRILDCSQNSIRDALVLVLVLVEGDVEW